jgi:hypothetical protein
MRPDYTADFLEGKGCFSLLAADKGPGSALENSKSWKAKFGGLGLA